HDRSMDHRRWRFGAKAFSDRLRRSHQEISLGGADLSSALRGSVVNGRTLDRFSVCKIHRVLRAALIGKVRALYVFLPTARSRRAERAGLSMALLRRSAPGRSDE